VVKSISVVCAVSVLFLSGCAYNASPYGASVKNVEAIKLSSIKPVSVGKFQSAKPGLSTITCRAAGPVTVSPSFEGYIEKAFIDELTLAGVYSVTSPLVLNGKLDEVDFSSGMTDGNWSFTLALTNARGESFTTKSKYGFSGSFVADKACQEVAQAFGPAVQKLIEDAVRDPKFKQIAN
jgi:hypothetical protein